jgi:hypothetical protein
MLIDQVRIAGKSIEEAGGIGLGLSTAHQESIEWVYIVHTDRHVLPACAVNDGYRIRLLRT